MRSRAEFSALPLPVPPVPVLVLPVPVLVLPVPVLVLPVLAARPGARVARTIRDVVVSWAG